MRVASNFFVLGALLVQVQGPVGSREDGGSSWTNGRFVSGSFQLASTEVFRFAFFEGLHYRRKVVFC